MDNQIDDKASMAESLSFLSNLPNQFPYCLGEHNFYAENAALVLVDAEHQFYGQFHIQFDKMRAAIRFSDGQTVFQGYYASVPEIARRMPPPKEIEDISQLVIQMKEKAQQAQEKLAELQAENNQLRQINARLENQINELSGTKAGYVYLIKSASGYYKIGRTKKPDDRIKTFSVKLPFEVEYDHLIYTFDMYQLEQELHQKFAAKRVGGEWFNLSSEDVEYIKWLG